MAARTAERAVPSVRAVACAGVAPGPMMPRPTGLSYWSDDSKSARWTT